MAKKAKKVAVVLCGGGASCVGDAQQCSAGCTGCATCVEVCKFDAVSIGDSGVAVVDRALCQGCGLCAKKCPQHIITVRDALLPISVRCSNTDKGAVARKLCESSCIACGICVKKCPAGALSIENEHAVIDDALCISCGLCAVSCPRGVIHDANGLFAVA